MKKLILSVVTVISLTFAYAQNIYTVNNAIGITADFDNLQTAINTVPSNSILLVHGSSFTYGNVVIRKPLTIVGPGYFLGSNAEPYTQANRIPATIGNIAVSAGSTGSLITGLTVSGTINFDSTSNVTFSRNHANSSNSLYVNRSSNINIIQNYLLVWLRFQNNSNVNLSNNVLTYNYFVDLNSGSSTNISHNVIVRPTTSYGIVAAESGTSATISNNVVVKTGTGNSVGFCNNCAAGSSVTATNNISTDSIFRGSSNALINVAVESIFANYASPSAAPDARFLLQEGSVAIGAGTGGADVGLFGGSAPYVLSGIPFIPNIYSLDVPTIGTTGTGLRIHVKAQTNN